MEKDCFGLPGNRRSEMKLVNLQIPGIGKMIYAPNANLVRLEGDDGSENHPFYLINGDHTVLKYLNPPASEEREADPASTVQAHSERQTDWAAVRAGASHSRPMVTPDPAAVPKPSASKQTRKGPGLGD